MPGIPLDEVVGSAFKLAPEQIGATGEKLGVTIGLTIIVSVCGVAHCPDVGVNE